MMISTDTFLKLPYGVQDLLVTAYDVRSYRVRRTGAYTTWRAYLAKWRGASADELQYEQGRRLSRFLEFATQRSHWYSSFRGADLRGFPVLEKADLLKNLSQVTTTSSYGRRIVSKTGGTTGASMRVFYRPEDIQERAAFLDDFRSQFGYELGDRVAWFSGKSIATDTDVWDGRCYRDDLIYHIRYFSTFHISPRVVESYWRALGDFGPSYVAGFPSSVHAVCAAAAERGFAPLTTVRTYFPTAETVLPEHRALIGHMLGCEVKDQYASSEGAPFIFECGASKLHIHPLSGVFEVVDEELRPAEEGEVLVTSFSTRGTPLIRYRIGDRLRLAPPGFTCDCGSSYPVVDSIDGRSMDYIFSPERGRVNLGNISNCTKGITGILSFQIVQERPKEANVRLVAGSDFNQRELARFAAALRERVGEAMTLTFEIVDEIPVEKSGKFRIVKNLLPRVS